MGKNSIEIPIWNKYALTIGEAVSYFNIGENRLRDLLNRDKMADYVLWNGNKALIKRRLFEEYIDGINVI